MSWIVSRKPIAEPPVLNGPFDTEEQAQAWLDSLPDEDDLEAADVLYMNEVVMTTPLIAVTLVAEDWDLLTDLIVHEQEILDQKESLAGLGDQEIEQAQIRYDGILGRIRVARDTLADLTCPSYECVHDAEAADQYDFLMLIAPEDRTNEQEAFVTHMGAVLSAEVMP